VHRVDSDSNLRLGEEEGEINLDVTCDVIRADVYLLATMTSCTIKGKAISPGVTCDVIRVT
jgi:hypothetical protein